MLFLLPYISFLMTALLKRCLRNALAQEDERVVIDEVESVFAEHGFKVDISPMNSYSVSC